MVPQELHSNILKTLESAYEDLLAFDHGSAPYLIFKDRILYREGKGATPECLAERLNLTRERIRQMETTHIVEPLRQAFLFDHHTGLTRRIRSGYADPLRTAYQRLGAEHDRTISTEDEWERIVADAFDVQPDDADLKKAMPLLRLLLNYELLTFSHGKTVRASVPAAITGGERERMRRTAAGLYKLLKSEFCSLNEYEIMSLWPEYAPGESVITPGKIIRILPFCAFAERTRDRKIRAKLNSLTTAGQAYWVLEEAGRPLHFEDIRNEIRRQLADDTVAESIQSAVSNSDRFTPDGRMGMWRLPPRLP